MLATHFYQLGRYSYRSRRLVGLIWLMIVVCVGAGAATLSGPTSDSFTVPGTDSQQALDLVEERFPSVVADGATARVAFKAPDRRTLTDPTVRTAVTDVLDQIQAGPQVVQLTSPYDAGLISEDGTIGLARVTYSANALELDEETRDVLTEAAASGRAAGLTVELGGDALEEAPEVSSELVGVAVAVLVLIITLGSLVAAGMPLVTGITGVTIGVAAVTAATGFIDIGSSTPILATMLGLAVAIDYALFIVSRYRHELGVGRDGADAAGRAIATAGSAVVFAGLTVIVALAGLSVVGIPLLTEMGLAAALTVGIAVLIALTLLPALLGFAGRRVLGGRTPGLRARGPEAGDADRPSLGRRWVGVISRRPVVVLTVAVVALGVIAIPVADMRLGLPDEGMYPADSTQRKAYDLVSEGFGPGFNATLMAVVDAAGSGDPQAAAAGVHAALSATDGVQAASSPEFNEAADTAIISIVPEGGPDSQATKELVDRVRTGVARVAGDHGASLTVTGLTAIYLDFNETMADALLPYLLLVVGLSVVLLMIVFRSLVVPVKAAAGFLLSVAATFGAVVAVFQWGWLTDVLGVEPHGMVIGVLPILIIGLVFGLAMDYEVFLVTRIREEYMRGAGAGTAVVIGFQQGARVVAAAATIMFSIFAGFVLGDEADIMQMGFALAMAILFDAFVVRMTIVPAVLALVGEWAWRLPRWPDRLLPKVDVEGERFARSERQRESQPSATSGA